MSSKTSSPLSSITRILYGEIDGYTKTRFVFSFLLIFISSLLAAAVPITYKLLIDAFTGKTSLASPLFIALLISAYALSQFFQRTVSDIRSVIHGAGSQRLNRNLSRRLFDHIIRLPLSFHLERRTGAIGETLNQGLSGCQTILQHLLFTFLPVIVEFVTIIAVLIHFGHALYLWIFAISGVAYTAAFWRGASTIAEPTRHNSNTHIAAHSVLTDSLLNCETIKYFTAETAISDRYDDALVTKESSALTLSRLRARNGILISIIFISSLALSLGFAGHEVLHGTMSAGDFVLINSYVTRLMVPLQTIGFAVRDVSQALAFIQKMLDIFEQPGEKNIEANALKLEVSGALSFDHVSFRYNADRSILNDVSFSVPSGKTLAIVGASGSGKSSLIRLLFRLYEPDKGRILLDGHSIDSLGLPNLRHAIAVVPQDTVLFNDTIGRNIAFGRIGASQRDVEEAARLAHLHDFIASLPAGYDTPVGERGLKLSGGEKQRVSIARAALKRPRIFVFDEATSSLDSATEREILRNLTEVSKTCTTLIIAHRLSTVVHADEIVVLEDGVIRERGTHAQLLALNQKYAQLWNTQQRERSISADELRPNLVRSFP